MDEAELLRDVAKRLRQGTSPLAVAQQVLRAQTDDLLPRLAVPRLLDEAIVAVVTGDAANLNRAIELSVVSPIPGTSGRYRMHDAVRRHHLASWGGGPDQQVPDALLELNGALVEHFDRAGQAAEALYHQLVVDGPAALARFEELFAEADKRFDLAGCRDLLDVLGERLSLVEAKTTWDAYRTYLDARGMWMDDWLATTWFLEPSESKAQLRRLLSKKGSSVLHLVAAGGMGKTMHLRWLIARRCVPQRIACARVDFDSVDMAAAIAEPWLVLLEIAAQLDRQLRDSAFLNVLKEHGHHLGRLRSTGDPGLAASPGVEALVRQQLAAGFAVLDPDELVLVVLDTLEVPLDPRFPGAIGMLNALADDLAAFRELSSGLRILLSGRLDVCEHATGFERLVGADDVLTLKGFTHKEADRYLRVMRKVGDPELRAAAVVAATERGTSRAMPFKVALIADVIEHRPDLPPTEIARFAQHDLLYLIKRVVERIDPMVRWVLRYGAVARQLDLAFMKDVMAPFLMEAMSTGQPLDDLEADDIPADPKRTEPLWSTGLVDAGGELSVDRLWEQLRAYAGAASWVRVERAAGTEILRFHPDVVEPMRRVLGEREIVDQLHERALAHFLQRAHRDMPRAERSWREATYHLFERHGPAAVDEWRRWLRDAPGVEGAVLRWTLAGEVASGRSGTELGEGVRNEARVEHGLAALQLEWLGVRVLRPQDRAQLVRQVVVVDDGSSSPDRIELARAALAVTSDADEHALALGSRVLDGPQPAADRLWISALMGDVLAERDPEEAHRFYVRAGSIAEEASSSPAVLALVAMRLASVALRRDRYDLALPQARRAVDLQRTPEALLLLSEVLLGVGDVEAAAALPAVGDPPEVQDLLVTRALLHLGEHRTAIDRLERSKVSTSALAIEIRGEAQAALLELEPALSAFAEAASRWQTEGRQEDAVRCQSRLVEILLRDLGHLEDAAAALASAMQSWPDEPRLILLRAEIAERRGEDSGVQELVASLLDRLEAAAAPPSQRIGVLIDALALEDPGAAEELWEKLHAALRDVEPAHRRLVLLGGLGRSVRAQGARSARQRAKVRRAVPSLPRAAPGEESRVSALLSITDAELDRIADRHPEGREKLAACSWLTTDGSIAVARAWVEAATRAGGDLLALGIDPPRLLRTIERSEQPLAAAAVAIGAAVAVAHPEPFLAVAEDQLARVRGTTGQWPGLLYEARAVAMPANAQHHLELAAQLYENLADAQRARRVLAKANAPATQVADERPAAGSFEVEVAFENGVFSRRLVYGAGHRQSVASSEPASALLGGLAEPGIGTAVIGEMLAGDPGAVARELGRLLFGDDDRVLREHPVPADVLCLLTDQTLAPLPWELAGLPADPTMPTVSGMYRSGRRPLREPEDIRALQIALKASYELDGPADGVLGPATRDALQRFARANELGSDGLAAEVEQQLLARLVGRRVLIIGAGDREQRTTRMSRHMSMSIVELYIDHRFEVELAQGPGLDGLRAHPEEPFGLVHIAAGFIEEREVLLDLGEDLGWSDIDPTATTVRLDRALAEMTPKPVVVLDPPAPRSDFELARQLLLRNAFAAELFALGHVRAVIATGLGSYGWQDEVSHTLVAALSAAQGIGSVAVALRDRRGDASPHDLQMLAPFGATAVFAPSHETLLPWLPSPKG